MTNREIIKEIAIREGIVTAEQAKMMEEKGEDIPLHTVSGWRQKNLYLREEEQGKGIEARLWLKKDGENRFYKQKAYLYTVNQVE